MSMTGGFTDDTAAATPLTPDAQIRAGIVDGLVVKGEVTAYVVLAEITNAVGARRVERVASLALPEYLERGLVATRLHDLGQ